MTGVELLREIAAELLEVFTLDVIYITHCNNVSV